MAVEASHLSFFPSQLITNNRDLMNSNQQNAYMYNHQIGTAAAPFAGTTPENLIPFPQSSFLCDSNPVKMCMKTDSGVTNLNVTRKRSRDSMNQFHNFLGQEFSLQMQQQQLEIETVIAQHTKKIRLEIEYRQKQQERLLLSAIGESVVKKMNEKDEQIQRMSKLNLFLQEKVKTLLVENQLWRNMAQTNEATAITLRSNLEQVLAHVSEEKFAAAAAGTNAVDAAAGADKAESCCGSTYPGAAAEEDTAEVRTLAAAEEGGRMCRKCGERESSVLLLPCRHLCLCGVCGSSLMHSCPVCHSSMDATVHVNMS